MSTDERLAKIESKLDAITIQLAESCTLHKACLARQNEHHILLYGNGGKDGLRADVAELQHSRNVFRWAFRLLWSALAGIAAALVSAIVSVRFRVD